MQKKGILFVINDFNIGGAEVFVLRLGKALLSNYEIFIKELYPENSKLEIKENFINAGFKVVETPSLSKKHQTVFWKMNALFYLFGVKEVYNKLKKWQIKRLFNISLKKNNIKIIHSHYYSSDTFVRENITLASFKWLITMHGDYNQLNFEKIEDKATFLKNARFNLEQCDVVTYVSDINCFLINKYQFKVNQLKKVYLGYEQPIFSPVKNGQFTFCMVARANPTKGWRETVEAFNLFRSKYNDGRLICVAPKEGIIIELEEENRLNINIDFVGYSENPGEFINESDVCLLPTYFESESTPYSVIEYLAYSKPVISTNAGEIEQMLCVGAEKKAGIILPINKNKISNYKLNLGFIIYEKSCLIYKLIKLTHLT